MITATLEVSPEQGDRLVLGEHEGKLSLAVRSLAVAARRTSSPAVELNELMLSPNVEPPPPPPPEANDDAGALEERLRAELAAMEERLRAGKEDEPPPKTVAPPARGDAPLMTVRVFRGNHPVEEVLFLREEKGRRGHPGR